MSTLGYIIVFTVIGSIASLVGGLLLVSKEKLAIRISHFLAALAGGVFLGTVFFDLLPEAAEAAGENINIFPWVLAGIVGFFLLERSIHWFHHHNRTHESGDHEPTISLIFFGDAFHNFIDGMIIAASFLVDVRVGIVTAFSVAAHEIPQEIGDFAVMLHSGASAKKAILLNVASGLTAIVGALLMYFIGEQLLVGILPVFLAIAAGFFIYIAASDIIPELQRGDHNAPAFAESALLMLGIVVSWVAVAIFE